MEQTSSPPVPAEPVPEACPLWGFQEIMDGMRTAGLPAEVAERLVVEYGRVACLRQIRWLPFRSALTTQAPAGLLRQSIEENWPPPVPP